MLKLLLCSGISQRRAAIVLRVHRKTVARKLRFLADQARAEQAEFLASLDFPIMNVQFDDLETIEHSKCKPLSVSLAVEYKTRRFLAFSVSQMPAKGLLAHRARKKYGFRKDLRPLGWESLFSQLKPIVHERALFESDQNPNYPLYVRRHFPQAIHSTLPGQRGALGGQGELKKIKFDPLFSLNHTCAMLRANINRLFRKTWCTTKRADRLADHIAIYMSFHNSVLLR